MGCSEKGALAFLVSLLLVSCAGSAEESATPDAAHLNTAVADLHQGQIVGSVPCLAADLPAQHIHVHLAIIDDGVYVKVPAGIGVGRPWGVGDDGFIGTGACFAWIHTHDTSGVVHIVTPEQKTYSLGDLFDVWGQPLGQGVVSNYRGRVQAFVNGGSYEGDPRAISLINLHNIVLELGDPPAVSPPSLYDFSTRRG